MSEKFCCGRRFPVFDLRVIGFLPVVLSDCVNCAGWCVQVFSADGRHLYDIGGSGSAGVSTRGTYSGVCMDDSGRYLATRTEKGRCIVQVFDSDGCWMFDVDSHDDRLRRPSGIDVDSAGFFYVADLGNDCIKKFPYM